jgi:SET and MYND domain-containing protein
MHKFPQAAEFQARMLKGLQKLYHPNNGKLGLAAMRAGVAHWHAGMIEAGHGMICKAYAVLMVSHGPNHAVTKDLEVIRRQTEQELRIFNAAKKQPMSTRH